MFSQTYLWGSDTTAEDADQGYGGSLNDDTPGARELHVRWGDLGDREMSFSFLPRFGSGVGLSEESGGDVATSSTKSPSPTTLGSLGRNNNASPPTSGVVGGQQLRGTRAPSLSSPLAANNSTTANTNTASVVQGSHDLATKASVEGEGEREEGVMDPLGSSHHHVLLQDYDSSEDSGVEAQYWSGGNSTSSTSRPVSVPSRRISSRSRA